jgi:Protein of unknown function (DUF1425)
MRTMQLFLAAALPALTLPLVLDLGGCAAPARTAVVQCPRPLAAPPAGDALVALAYDAMTPIPVDAVQFTNEALAHQVVVQQLSAHRTPTDTVQVTARLVNCTDAPVVVGSRLHFMDANHLPLEDVSVWQRVVLRPRAMAQLQESSLTRGVEHYVVELRDERGPL